MLIKWAVDNWLWGMLKNFKDFVKNQLTGHKKREIFPNNWPEGKYGNFHLSIWFKG